MPFSPLYTNASQRQAFANRLAYHLAALPAAPSLMALQEAFAQAGGFPNAHAAQATLKRQKSVLFRLGIGATEDLSAPFLFLGIGPAKLFAWASESKKKYAAIVTRRPFTRADAEELLTRLWNHESWEKALDYDPLSLPDPFAQRRLVTAASLKELNKKAWEQSHRRFRGLCSVWGQRPTDEHWVGQTQCSARDHTLLLEDDDPTREALVKAQIAQRLAKKDRILLMDTSDDHRVGYWTKRQAQEQGHAVTVIDWTQQTLDSVGVESLGKALLIDVLYQCLTPQGASAEEKGKLISFLAQEFSLPQMPTPAVAWEKGLLLGKNLLEWRLMVQDFFKQFSGEPKQIFHQDVVVWLLPKDSSNENPRFKLAMAAFKAMVAHELERPLSPEDSHQADAWMSPPKPNTTPNTAAFILSAHPLNYPLGTAVIYAQGRALGISVFTALKAADLLGEPLSDETKAMIANMNTWVIGGPRNAKDPLWAAIGTPGKQVPENQVLIESGGDSEYVVPYR